MIFWIVIGLALVVAAPFAFESWRKVPAMPPDAAGERLRLSQGTTYVEWIGPARGPVVVAVHGLTTPSPVWRRLAERLGRAGYRVLVYDLYGRGLSGNAPGDQDPEFFLRQLRDVLDHHGLDEDVTLMGYSMGGAIVTAFAAAHPERIKRLILLAPVGLGHRIGGFLPFCARLPLVGDWLWLAVGPLGLRATIRRLPEAPEIAEVQRAETRRRGYFPSVLSSFRHTIGVDQTAEHRALYDQVVPVMAIWGDKDESIPIEGVGRLAQANRDAKQEVVRGAGHALPVTHVDEVSGHIVSILRER